MPGRSLGIQIPSTVTDSNPNITDGKPARYLQTPSSCYQGLIEASTSLRHLSNFQNCIFDPKKNHNDLSFLKKKVVTQQESILRPDLKFSSENFQFICPEIYHSFMAEEKKSANKKSNKKINVLFEKFIKFKPLKHCEALKKGAKLKAD